MTTRRRDEARRERGSPIALARWFGRLPRDAERGRLELLTDGLLERQVISSWPDHVIDTGDVLAEDVYDAASCDAEGRGGAGMVAYRLVYIVDDREVMTFAMRVAPSAEAAANGASPAPNADALIGQILRHSEAATRTAMAMMVAAQKQLQENNAILAKRLSYLERARTEALQMERDAMLAASAGGDDDGDARDERRLAKLMEFGQLFLAERAAQDAPQPAVRAVPKPKAGGE